MRIENSFIPVRGVGEATEQRLWRQGVTHWEEFRRDVNGVGPTTAERIESFIDVATERLARNDAQFFGESFPQSEQWRLYENFRDSACFFDIETTGLSHGYDDITTVTFHRGGQTTTLVRGEDLDRHRIRQQLDAADLLVTFNGKRFDVPFLERSFDVDITTPHLDLLYVCRKLDLTGGLKAIEQELDIDRNGPDLSGRDAVRLWNQYRNGDNQALDTLVRYNRDDTVNLQTLADEAIRRLDRHTFPDQ